MSLEELLDNSIGTSSVRQKTKYATDYGLQIIMNYLEKKIKHNIDLNGFPLMFLVQGAVRIQLSPHELEDNDYFAKEYTRRLYNYSYLNEASLLAELYNEWYDNYPKDLMKSFNNLYPSIKYDLIDPNSDSY